MAFNPNRTADELGFRLTECLGTSGFGQVWKGEPKDGGDAVAIKFVSHATDAERQVIEQYRSKKVQHPNLVDIYNTKEADDWLVLVMLFCETTLKDRLKECVSLGESGLPTKELLGYMLQTADAIDYLNDQGLTHRDIKTHNILLKDGVARCSDLGLRKLRPDPNSWHGGFGLSPYSAPETAEGRISASFDQYSLALTYYELRCGKLPFDGRPFGEIVELKAKGKLPLDGITPEEREIVAQALSPEPSKRFLTCRTMIDRLQALFPDPVKVDLTAPADDNALPDDSGLLAIARGQLEELLARQDGKGEGVAAHEIAESDSGARLVEESPRCLQDFLRLATRLFAEKRYGDAAEYFAEAIAHGDGRAETRLQLAESLFNLGNYAQSVLEYNAAIPGLSKKAHAYHQRGKACQAVGKFDEAIHDFGLALEHSNPITQRSARATFRNSLARVLCDRGQTRMRSGRPDDAVNDFNKAIEIDKNFVDAYVGRGRAYFAKEAYQQAIEEFSEAIKRDGANSEIFIARGLAHYAKATERKKNVRLFRGVLIEEDGPQPPPEQKSRGKNPQSNAEASGFTSESVLFNSTSLSRLVESRKPIQYRGANESSIESKSHTELERAIRDYGRALDLDPESIDAYQHRAEAQHALGQHLEAVRDYTQVIRRRERHDQAHFGLGQVNFDTENFQEAVERFTRTIELNPNFAHAFYRRAMAYHHLGAFREAVADYSEAITKGTAAGDKFFAKSDAFFNRAEAEFLAGNFVKAIADYTEALQRGSQSPLLYFNRGRAFRAAGNTADAVIDFQKAIALEETFAEAHAHLADVYLATNEFSNALLHYATASKIDPAQDERFRMLCARVYVKWGDFAFERQKDIRKAKQKYSDAIDRHPKLADAHARMGKVHVSEENLEAALQSLNEAVQLEPECAEFLQERGEVQRQRRDFSAAADDFDRAIAIDGGLLGAYLGRALSRGDSGDVDRAIDDLNYVLEREPYHVDANFHAGILHGSHNRFDSAIFHLLRAYESGSREEKYSVALANALHERGKERYQHGDWDGARSDFDIAIEYNPKCEDAFYSRARLRVASGEYEAALSDVNAFLDRGGVDIESIGAHAHVELGLKRLQKHDYAAAVELFTQAVNAGYVHSVVYGSRGAALAKLGQLDASLEDYESALSYGADEEFALQASETYWQRGCQRLEESDYANCIADFRRVIELTPDWKEALIMIGRAAFAMGNLEEAIESLEKSGDCSPEIFQLLGAIYLKRGRKTFAAGTYESALRDFEHSVSVSDGAAESLYWRGMTYWKIGRIDEMVADLSRARDADQENARYRKGLATAFFELGTRQATAGESEPAVSSFTQSIENQGDDPKVFVSRARALSALAKFEAACGDFDTACKLMERSHEVQTEPTANGFHSRDGMDLESEEDAECLTAGGVACG